MQLDIPGYKLKRVIGKGGMARVYLAEQKIFEREVALKVMSKHLSEDTNFGKRFLQEARIVAKLVHPNIVTVHDVGVHNGRYYLSMEYIDGDDLKLRRKNLSLIQKLTAIRDIAKALDYAGGKGYVHRDIKPENIMFHKTDGRAVLTDFGIARAAEVDLAMTQTGLAIGTPHYMSPEQAKGKPVDSRSDIYSLGVVLYLLLVGEMPYNAESAVAIGIKHVTEPVPLLPSGYEGLQVILDRMMSKVADKRYQSAAELIDDLDALDFNQLIYAIEQNGGDASVEVQGRVIRCIDTSGGSGNTRAVDTESLTTQNTKVEADIDTEQFTITEADIRELPDQKMIWPWFFSLVILCSGVLAVIYFLRPAILSPHIDQLERWGKTQPNAPASDAPIKGPSENNEVSLRSEPSSQSQPSSTPSASAVANRFQGNNASTQALNEIDKNTLNRNSDKTSSESLQEGRDLIYEKYQIRLTQAYKAYQNDESLLAEYVDAHRDLLANYPEDSATLASLKQLHDSLQNELLDNARNGKPTTARRQLTQFRYLFSKLPADDDQYIETQLRNISKSRYHIKKADQYFKQQSLSKPEGANAITSYQEALKLDPLSPLAQKGLNESLNTLALLAQRNKENGQDLLGVSQAQVVLSHDPQHDMARRVLENVGDVNVVTNESPPNQSLTNQSLINQYTKAQSALRSGNLYEPTGDNAYDYFRAMLNVEPSNQNAKDGLSNLPQRLSDKVSIYLSRGELINARSVLRRPLDVMSNNPTVQRLSREVEKAIIDKRQSVNPVVNAIILRDVPTEYDSYNSNTGAVIEKDKIWYLVLTYERITAQNANVNIVFSRMPNVQEVFAISRTLKGSDGDITLSSADLDLNLNEGSYQVRVSIANQYGNDELLDASLFTIY